jgi:uncharacterized protein (TIGR03067 family)
MVARSLAALAIGLLTTTLVAQDAIERELELLQGDWEEVARDGKTTRYSFRGDAYYFIGPIGRELMVSFRIDATQQPKHFDIVPGRNPVIPGIYKIEGDVLTICRARIVGEGRVAGERPTEFAKNTDRQITVWKRVRK